MRHDCAQVFRLPFYWTLKGRTRIHHCLGSHGILGKVLNSSKHQAHEWRRYLYYPRCYNRFLCLYLKSGHPKSQKSCRKSLPCRWMIDLGYHRQVHATCCQTEALCSDMIQHKCMAWSRKIIWTKRWIVTISTVKAWSVCLLLCDRPMTIIAYQWRAIGKTPSIRLDTYRLLLYCRSCSIFRPRCPRDCQC